MVEDTKKISKFNMASAVLERINDCLIRAFRKYQSGDISGWFYELKGIKMQIIAKLSSKERGILEQLEDDIGNKLNQYNKEAGGILSYKLIEEYNEHLQDYMELKGMLLVDKEDESVFT